MTVTAFPSSTWDRATIKAPGFGANSYSETHQYGDEEPMWQGTHPLPLRQGDPMPALRTLTQ